MEKDQKVARQKGRKTKESRQITEDRRIDLRDKTIQPQEDKPNPRKIPPAKIFP